MRTGSCSVTWLLCAAVLTFGCSGGASVDAGPDASPPDATPGDAAELCRADRDCVDDAFCDGLERCDPGHPAADARGCVPGTPPCDPCDELEDRCDDGCDVDGDGHRSLDCGGDDCDDSDPDRFPGNPERCEERGHDEDCDPSTIGRDLDGDGFVDDGCCQLVDGVERCGTDCDDASAEVNPHTSEICNGRDDDCDGMLDGPHEDDDGDGWPDACAGLPVVATDCDDEDPTVHPGAPERCDRVDSDCSELGGVDPLEDADADGHAPRGAACSGGLPADDCDDSDPSIRPGSDEVCGGVDEDCDGRTDEDPAASLCALPHALPVCGAGGCEVGACEPGWGSCDPDHANGCEADLLTSSAHCGACDLACIQGGTCRAGVCHPYVQSAWTGLEGTELAVDRAGNAYLAGRDGVISLGPTGDRRWTLPLPLGVVADAVAAADGALYVGGRFSSTLDLGTGAYTSEGFTDAWVARLNASTGATDWVVAWQASGADRVAALAANVSGVWVASYVFPSVAFGGATLEGNDLVRLDSEGALVWAIDTGATTPTSLEVGADDRSYLGAATGVRAFDPDGNQRWARPGSTRALALAADRLVAAGGFAGTVDYGAGPMTSAGSEDGWVGAWSLDGTLQFTDRFGSGGTDRAGAVAIAASGEIIVGDLDEGGVRAWSAAGEPSWTLDFARLDAHVRVFAMRSRASSASVAVLGTYSGVVDFGRGLVASSSTDTYLLDLVP